MRDKNGIETRVEDEYGIKTLTFIFASIRSRSLQIRKKTLKLYVLNLVVATGGDQDKGDKTLAASRRQGKIL